jgi:hypothetical protein
MSYFFRFIPVVKKQILSFRASLVELFSKKIFGRASKKKNKEDGAEISQKAIPNKP